MQITIMGVITILISIYGFLKNKKLLLYTLVFVSTFTASEVLHIESTTTLIIPFEFVGLLWLLREFIDYIKTKPKINIKEIVNKFKENKIALAFAIFIMAIILGELALAISGIYLEYVDINGETKIITFTKSNLTQPIMIIFVFVLMITLSFTIKSKEEIKKLLKVFAISSLFAVIWGLLQFITYYLGVPYPNFLFNNNVYATQCYDQIVNNIKRICSIALEPSTFAVNLTCFLPFVLGTYLVMKNKVKEKKYIITFIILVLTTTCTILTTSTTTYVGLVVEYALFGIYILFGFIKNGELSNRKSNFTKMLVVTLTSIAVAGCLCVTFVKIGYKLGTIEYIQVIPEEEEETEEVQYRLSI